jgi:hypothetical protein
MTTKSDERRNAFEEFLYTPDYNDAEDPLWECWKAAIAHRDAELVALYQSELYKPIHHEGKISTMTWYRNGLRKALELIRTGKP